MSNTKQWIISALDIKPTADGLTDVVSTIHWRRQATEVTNVETYVADIYGACAIPAPTPEAFISFQDITEQEVIAWLESELKVEELDATLDAQIETQMNPPIKTVQAPWIQLTEIPSIPTNAPAQVLAEATIPSA